MTPPAMTSQQQQQHQASTSTPTVVVVGLGDPVMDVLFELDHAVLASIAEKPGGCIPITHDEHLRLTAIAAEHCDPVRIPGGSAANVMKGVANLSAGSVCCRFMGMVGTDSTADAYRRMLQQQGVQPVLLETSAGPTATCLCFVTPDGQRTMRTCLEASAHLQSAEQLPREWCSGAKLLHCEGYCLYRPQVAREAMARAKQAGALVSIDLASFECVQNCSSALMELLSAGLIDLVFANEDEAAALLGVLAAGGNAAAASAPEADKVEAAQKFVLQYAQICVVSLGARGCVARAKDGTVGRAPAGGVKVVDTIGAGDYFTSGFLYAHLMGCSLQQCAQIGCQAGSEAVKVKGSILSEAAWQSLRSRVDELATAGGQSAAAQQQPGSVAADAGPAAQLVHSAAKVDASSCVLTAA